ncbi:MAG: DUF3237 domain-containing protein [Erysipelotrichaceae bacterium]|nr:DUF3237 domain-containing protein [Erysipelotrichaceae bacterium]
MAEKGKLILEILVQTDKERTKTIETRTGTVKMIPFSGIVKSGIMTGIVEDTGVDTQITNQNGVRHMSARYMLSGCDSDGESCNIYVENNAWFTNGERPKPFRTVPTFYTDSKKYADYLTRNAFIGEGLRDEEGLRIRFYEMAEGE